MRRLALVLSALVLLGFIPAQPASAATYTSELLKYTNAQRVKYHLTPFKESSCLDSRFAVPWSKHLAAQRTLVHQSLSPMMSQCHGSAAAENLAKGNVTPQQMVAMWMNSPGHRRNILNPSYTRIGLGATRGSDHNVYGVQDFLNN